MSQELHAIEFSLKYRIFDNALLLCGEYFARAPSSQLLYLYAKTYLDSGSPVQAALLCKQHEHLIENNADLRIIWAQALFESGTYSESELVLKRLESSASLSPDQQAVMLHLHGMIKLRTHRHALAASDFSRAVKAQPLLLSAVARSLPDPSTPPPEPPHGRRSLLTPKQLRAGAKPTTPKRSKSPTNASLTASLFRNSTNPLAVIKTFPSDFANSIQVLKVLGCYYFRCAKYHDAARVFRKLYELHPHSIEGLDTFSTVLWQLKDEKSLNQLSRRAVSLAPSRAETWIATGNLFSLQHNTDAAIQMFQRAASIDKSSSYSLALAGHEQLLFDRAPEAAKHFREAIDRNPLEWSAWYGLGSVYYKQDNFGAAEYYMKKALDLNPTSSVLHYVYAMVLKKCGRDDDAERMFDKSLEIDPMNVVAAFQKGLLLSDMGNVSGAIECLKRVASLIPLEPGVALLRGKIAQSLGNATEATAWFTEALIYGHPDKKEIISAIESLTDRMVDSVLGEEPLPTPPE
jgi:anaphase-promoting complex subunit 3